MTIGENISVWLYGSHARGDVDDLSDVDVLCIADAFNVGKMGFIREKFPWTRGAQLSHFSWDEIQGMAMYGSLFLHHINLEGRKLYECGIARGRLEEILSDLPKYGHARRDLHAFRVVLADVYSSLTRGPASTLYEASVIATVLRHASILGCYAIGEPCFSRTKPVACLVSSLKLPQTIATRFPELYKARIAIERHSMRAPMFDMRYVMEWLHTARNVLDMLEGVVDEYETTMLGTASSREGSG